MCRQILIILGISMRQSSCWWASLLFFGISSSLYASNLSSDTTTITNNQTEDKTEVSVESSLATTTTVHKKIRQHLKVLSTELKVDANANQPEQIKDPFQPFNRKVYVFNDFLDRHILRPVAVGYKKTIPLEVQGSYRSFHNNLGEPWNATNQAIQGKPLRALKTVGRFALNTLTTLGLADPAQRLNLNYESESLGTTLGYYGVASGPYIMLPFFGPSTVRDGLGTIIDSQAQVQRYAFDDYLGLYWSDMVVNGVDLRSSLLDMENVLQGDRYSAIRDIYLQRKKFIIAEKKGTESQDVSFVGDDVDNSTP